MRARLLSWSDDQVTVLPAGRVYVGSTTVAGGTAESASNARDLGFELPPMRIDIDDDDPETWILIGDSLLVDLWDNDDDDEYDKL